MWPRRSLSLGHCVTFCCSCSAHIWCNGCVASFTTFRNRCTFQYAHLLTHICIHVYSSNHESSSPIQAHAYPSVPIGFVIKMRPDVRVASVHHPLTQSSTHTSSTPLLRMQDPMCPSALESRLGLGLGSGTPLFWTECVPLRCLDDVPNRPI